MPNKVIVVSGGAGGIGSQVSDHLSREGANLVIADLNAREAQAKAAQIEAQGAQAIGLACDLANPADCGALAEQTVEKFGRLDGIVNCAGISKPHDSLTLPSAEWARMIDVQLSGAFYFAQACARKMSPGAAIVFITSTNAEAAFPRRLLLRQSRRRHAHESPGHRMG